MYFRVLKLSILFASIFTSLEAFSYANFIGYGYSSCLNCHYNPYGNGPLTDYGRGVGATAITDNAFYPDSWDDQYISEHSGFLHSKPSQKYFRPSINYRGLQLISGYDSENENEEYINMLLSGSVVFRAGDKQEFIAVAEIGYAPGARGSSDEGNAEYWYNRAVQPVCITSLDAEWKTLYAEFEGLDRC